MVCGDELTEKHENQMDHSHSGMINDLTEISHLYNCNHSHSYIVSIYSRFTWCWLF
jgi:hypothetical protein